MRKLGPIASIKCYLALFFSSSQLSLLPFPMKSPLPKRESVPRSSVFLPPRPKPKKKGGGGRYSGKGLTGFWRRGVGRGGWGVGGFQDYCMRDRDAWTKEFDLINRMVSIDPSDVAPVVLFLLGRILERNLQMTVIKDSTHARQWGRVHCTPCAT